MEYSWNGVVSDLLSYLSDLILLMIVYIQLL